MIIGNRRGQIRRNRSRSVRQLFLLALPYGLWLASFAPFVFVLHLQNSLSNSGSLPHGGSSTGTNVKTLPLKRSGGRVGASSPASDQKRMPINLDVDPVAADLGDASSPNRHVGLMRPRKLTPIFRCLDGEGNGSDHTKKVVFVHVFKTAGSTLREFFADYARRCHAGWAVIIGCTRLKAESLVGDDRWTARRVGKAEDCLVKRSVARSGEGDDRPGPVTNGRLAASFDMFGGHLPLGTGAVWNDVADDDGKPKRDGITYISFFRNAVNKFLSGVSFVTQAGKPPKAIKQLKDVVPEKLANGFFHSKFGDYLITPQQRRRDEQKGVVLSSEEQALRVMLNLLDFDVVVGITERMSDSLRLLEVLMDEDRSVPDVFDKYGRVEEGSETGSAKMNIGSAVETRKANISKMSTSDLAKELMKEPFFFLDVLEYTKYEQQISDFALALHLRQLTSVGVAKK